MRDEDRCKEAEVDDPSAWRCYKRDGHEGGHGPALTDEGREFVLSETHLNGALFELANIFNVPLTNNDMPWLEEDGTPVYDVGDFIDLAREVIKKFGQEA